MSQEISSHEVKDISDSTPLANSPQKSLRQSRWKLGMAIILMLAVGGTFWALRSSEPTPAPVEVLPASIAKVLGEVFPKPQPTFFERHVPRTAGWAWLWKLREAIFGKPKPFDLTVEMLQFSESRQFELPGVPSQKPAYFNTNGLQLWFVDGLELKAMTKRLNETVGTRMVTHSSSQTPGVTVRMGLNGTRIAALGQTKSKQTDFYVDMVASDYAWSTVRLRCQVPRGNGLFLLHIHPKTGTRSAMSIDLSFPTQKN